MDDVRAMTTENLIFEILLGNLRKADPRKNLLAEEFLIRSGPLLITGLLAHAAAPGSHPSYKARLLRVVARHGAALAIDELFEVLQLARNGTAEVHDAAVEALAAHMAAERHGRGGAR
jgi:hypothetical protein